MYSAKRRAILEDNPLTQTMEDLINSYGASIVLAAISDSLETKEDQDMRETAPILYNLANLIEDIKI